jgi:hypothetical protein
MLNCISKFSNVNYGIPEKIQKPNETGPFGFES